MPALYRIVHGEVSPCHDPQTKIMRDWAAAAGARIYLVKATGIFYFPAAILSFLIAPIIYAHGILSGHFLDFRAREEYCGEGLPDGPPTSWSWIPLRHLCKWSDGSSTELVPPYVNPILAACLILTVTFIVLAGRARRANVDRPAS